MLAYLPPPYHQLYNCFILLWRQDVIPCFQRVQKFGLTLPYYFTDCRPLHVKINMSSQPVIAFMLICQGCQFVHFWVFQVTWLRCVVFDRLVNGLLSLPTVLVVHTVASFPTECVQIQLWTFSFQPKTWLVVQSLSTRYG